jgi:aryl-alcohol dehydrogenase-like predicted oxidoreductase
MKLALGTAQFGMDYGVTNHRGRPESKEIEKILVTASESGVDFLDTARAYGQSEEILGEILGNNHSFKIVTKTLPLGVDVIGKYEIDKLSLDIECSLTNLHYAPLYGLLIHHGEELLLPGGELLFAKLQDLKNSGQIKKIGVSVYLSKCSKN